MSAGRKYQQVCTWLDELKVCDKDSGDMIAILRTARSGSEAADALLGGLSLALQRNDSSDARHNEGRIIKVCR